MVRHGLRLVLGLAGLLLTLTPGAGARAGTPAVPHVLQGLFSFDDVKEGRDNCTQFQVQGDRHDAGGVVTAVGLSGDTIVVSYTLPLVDSFKAGREDAKVGQRQLAEIDVDLTPGAASTTIAYNGRAFPEKGKVFGRVARQGNQARVKASFQLGDLLGDLAPPPDTRQLDSLVTAFRDRKDVKLREKNGSLKITHQGSTTGSCP